MSGCGGSDDSADNSDAAATSAPAKPAAPGPFFGECGSVTDQEVLAAFAMPALPVVWRNSVGCVWEASGPQGPSVSFSWYRGSPIGREAAGSGLIGRPPETIDVKGHPGFKGSAGNQLCEIGVQFGDDFIHWSVTYADVPATADPCKVANDLAELTVSRAK
ncbi:DUF3558 domain-containing protein [Antrihabitans cavernicola]|uniref:DUF3558 domain-containing protein n=2 Tax=Antrihabitans cavernicola TaxID=2495913 RepID=A0A5A7S267_9NOCA|nr:DUF3558 domain-containing protein [Spelaeibacter cavernicola]KAA0017989.1 DUF3558 domain-containing protein [Spelaeibacter cavernicola]